MIETPGLPLTLLAFLLVIGPLVFVHELGHYLAGRWFGVKSEAFSIGFGREILGWTDRLGTRWKLGWMPLGGYVRFAGDMNAVSQPSAEWLALSAEERNKTFQAKPVWQRAIIVAAGPIVNFAIAILILGGFAIAFGDTRTPPVIGSVVAGSAAERAGLQEGDRITRLGDRNIAIFEDMLSYTRIHPGEATQVAFTRGGQTLTAPVTIGVEQQTDRFGNSYRIGMLGIARGERVTVPVSLIEAPVIAVRRTGEIVSTMVETIGQIISGRRSVKELGGPLSIAKVSGEQITLGPEAFVFLIALVSINLGFINLLPVPMLDGGHLLFYAIEALRRRPVGPEAQEWAFRGGLAAILGLMLLVTFNDLENFGLWRSLARLIG